MKAKWFSGFDWQSLLDKELEPPFVPEVKDPLDASNFDSYEEEDDSDDGLARKPCAWNPEQFS